MQTDLSTWDFTDPCNGCGGRVPIAQAAYFEDHEGNWIALCPACTSDLVANVQRAKDLYQQARRTLIAYARQFWIGKSASVENVYRRGWFLSVTQPITRITPSGRVYLAGVSDTFFDIEEIIRGAPSHETDADPQQQETGPSSRQAHEPVQRNHPNPND